MPKEAVEVTVARIEEKVNSIVTRCEKHDGESERIGILESQKDDLKEDISQLGKKVRGIRQEFDTFKESYSPISRRQQIGYPSAIVSIAIPIWEILKALLT
jgi:hypothetical protein